MNIIKKRYFRQFFDRLGHICGILVLFLGTIFFSSILIAESFSSGVFSQSLIQEVLEEETCSFSSPEVTYPYTQLHASIFQRDSQTPLPPITQTWSISCSQPIEGMRFWVTDMVASSVADGNSTHFGLGHVNSHGNLGYYTVTLANPQVDGKSVLLYQSSDETVVGQPQTTITLQSNKFHGWVMPGGSVASGQQFSVNLTVSPTLNSLANTNGPLVEGAELDGELMLNLSFGI